MHGRGSSARRPIQKRLMPGVCTQRDPPELRQPCGTGRLSPGSAMPSTCRSSPSWAAEAAAARLRTDGCAPRSCPAGGSAEGPDLPAESKSLHILPAILCARIPSFHSMRRHQQSGAAHPRYATTSSGVGPSQAPKSPAILLSHWNPLKHNTHRVHGNREAWVHTKAEHSQAQCR